MAHRDLLPPDARITLDHLQQKPLSPGAACSSQAAVLQVLQATRRHNTQSRRDIWKYLWQMWLRNQFFHPFASTFPYLAIYYIRSYQPPHTFWLCKRSSHALQVRFRLLWLLAICGIIRMQFLMTVNLMFYSILTLDLNTFMQNLYTKLIWGILNNLHLLLKYWQSLDGVLFWLQFTTDVI